MFELFPRVNFNRIQQGYSKLKLQLNSIYLKIKVKVNYLILNTSNALCIPSNYAEVPQFEASIAVCGTEIKAEKEIVKFLNDIKEVNWELVLSPFSETPSLMVDKFHEIFDGLLDAPAPIRRKKIRNEPAPWVTPQIRRLMEGRDRAKKNSIRSPKLLKSYKSLRNKVTNTIRSTIRLHYQSLINENKDNPKTCGEP